MKQKRTVITGLMSAALALGVQQAEAAVTNDVSGGIGINTTWYSNQVYKLLDTVLVTNGATLTIQPGTVIRGGSGQTALVISRGSKIQAVGTAANPIVFTCLEDDNIGANPGSGVWANKNNGIGQQWGGVILLGKTYLASNTGGAVPSPNSALQLQIEGIADFGDLAKYGGGSDDDDSGTMRYCSIRYGGYILASAKEINGLTLGAVGRQTDIDHIEVFQNSDDDVEFFGGTVNLKYIVAWNSGDDGFDTDEGYRGKGQFMLRVQGPLSTLTGTVSDKGTEEDGAMGDLLQPSSIPTWFNWTQIGLGKATSTKNTAIHMRDGTGARFYNGLWMDFGGACALIEGDAGDSDGDTASKFGETYVNNGLLGAPDGSGVPTGSGNGYDHEATWLDGSVSKKAEMKYNVFWKMGTNVAFACTNNTTGIAAAWGAEDDRNTKLDGNKAHYGYPLFTDALLKNLYLDEGAFLSPVSNLVRRATPVTISSVDYYPVETLNPLPRGSYDGTLMTHGRVPPNDGFYTPVNFIGAFGKIKNWAQGWTLASRLGLIQNATAGDYTGVVPQCRNSGGNLQVKLACDVYDGIQADYYIVVDGGTYGWFYFNLATGWQPLTSIGTPIATLANTPLGNFDWVTVLPTAVLPVGQTTPLFFAIDMVPGNGIIDLDRSYIGSVWVTK